MSRKTFFITGSNSGFGLAIAAAALQAGHRVIGTVRSQASLTALAKTLPGLRPASATSPSSTGSMMSSATRKTSMGRSTC